MVITGTLVVKYDVRQVSDAFKSREFVVEYIDNPLYPQYIKFESTQDRCSLIEKFEPGEQVEVSFNIRGRKWVSPQGEEKYFNSLEAWRIQVPTPSENEPEPAHAGAGGEPLTTPESDDLPF